MKLPNSIITERLILKPVSINDIDLFYKAFKSSFENLTQYYIPAWSRYKQIPSKNEMLEFLKENQDKWNAQDGFLFSVFDKKTNEFIGQGEIHHFDHSVPKARLGYWITNGKTGNDYATEMAHALTLFGFDVLNCNRLEIRNDVRNPASGAIAKKLGYKFLAIFEKNKVGKPNDFWDLEIYARTNKEGLPDKTVEFSYD
ncbi:MAG: hypothetical protein CMH31_03090 [Micavibrio sp.]|nr:hypothetical protein [Micavibrio sp.]